MFPQVVFNIFTIIFWVHLDRVCALLWDHRKIINIKITVWISGVITIQKFQIIFCVLCCFYFLQDNEYLNCLGAQPHIIYYREKRHNTQLPLSKGNWLCTLIHRRSPFWEFSRDIRSWMLYGSQSGEIRRLGSCSLEEVLYTWSAMFRPPDAEWIG